MNISDFIKTRLAAFLVSLAILVNLPSRPNLIIAAVIYIVAVIVISGIYYGLVK